ncbi:hypothetical protein ACFLZH_02170 [Patescibacteria group bacterium]
MVTLHDEITCAQIGTGTYDALGKVCTLDPDQSFNGSILIDGDYSLVGNNLTVTPDDNAYFGVHFTSLSDDGKLSGTTVDGSSMLTSGFVELLMIEADVLIEHVTVIGNGTSIDYANIINVSIRQAYDSDNDPTVYIDGLITSNSMVGLLAYENTSTSISGSQMYGNILGGAVIGASQFTSTGNEYTDNVSYGLMFGEEFESTNYVRGVSLVGDILCGNGVSDWFMAGVSSGSIEFSDPPEFYSGPFGDPDNVLDPNQYTHSNQFGNIDRGAEQIPLEDFGTQIECPAPAECTDIDEQLQGDPYTAVTACNDLNGNDIPEALDHLEFNNFFVQYPALGTDFQVLNAFHKTKVAEQFDDPLGTISKNDIVMDGLLEECTSGCGSDEVAFDITHPDGAVKNAMAEAYGAWTDKRGTSVRYEDVYPVSHLGGDPTDATTEVSFTSYSDGMSISSGIRDIEQGKGVYALAEIEKPEYTFTRTGITAYCDGVQVTDPLGVGGCLVTEIREAGRDLLRFEAFATEPGLLHKNEDGAGFKDQKTGAGIVGNNPICDPLDTDCDDLGVTHYNADVVSEIPNQLYGPQTEDMRAHLDAFDLGYADFATTHVTVSGDTVTMTIEAPVLMPTADRADGVPANMALGLTVALGPVSSLAPNGPALYTMRGNSYKEITSVGGMIWSPLGQSNSSSAQSSIVEYDNVLMMGMMHRTDHNAIDLDKKWGTFNEQAGVSIPQFTSISKTGGKLKVVDSVIVNAEHSQSTIPSDIKGLLNSNYNIKGLATGGIYFADTNGRQPSEAGTTVTISDNYLGWISGAGVAAYGAESLIERNEMHFSQDTELERWRDEIRFEYSGEYSAPLDKPQPDGGASIAMTDRGAPEGSTAISISCGYKNIDSNDTDYDLSNADQSRFDLVTEFPWLESEFPNAGEEDSYGNFFNGTSRLKHTNCYANLIKDNTAYSPVSGIVIAGEWDPSSKVCDSLLNDPSICDITDGLMSGANVALIGNVVKSETPPLFQNDEPDDLEAFWPPHKSPNSPSLVLNDNDKGPSSCVIVTAPGVRELGIDPNTALMESLRQFDPDPLTFYDGSVDVTAGLPQVLVKDTICGDATDDSPGGGTFSFGSVITYFVGNEIYGSLYSAAGSAFNMTMANALTISKHGAFNAGVNWDGVTWIHDAYIPEAGRAKDTCTMQTIGESTVGGDPFAGEYYPGVTCEHATDSSISFAMDAGQFIQEVNPLPGAAYIVTRSTFDKLGIDLGGVRGGTAEDIADYLQNVIGLKLAGNKTFDGEDPEIKVINYEHPDDAELKLAKKLFYEDTLETDKEKLMVRVGERGNGTNKASNADVSLYTKACALEWNNDPADVVDNCSAVDTSSSAYYSNDRYAYHMLLANEGQYYVAATYDMLDPMGLPVQSSHPTVNLPQNDFVNIIVHVNPNGVVQGMKGKLKEGSALWVHEPTSVVWVNEVEYYPFFFESDSDWTVDICMEVPEGYEIIEGEGCVQSFVANEEKTVLFKVEEVGSVPGNSKIKWKFRGPDGKLIKEESTVGIRLHPSLYKDKKGELEDYELDEKGRLKKVN